MREGQRFCLVLVAVVGIEVEVCAGLHRSIRQCLEDISLDEGVSNRLDSIKIELLGGMSPDGGGVWRVVGRFADVVD